ncbi:MAG: hypothetical protein JXQ73_09485 [Phycisphaerae bacterium]|nr:hypothetical protein [Phycisphaerae bacterium]
MAKHAAVALIPALLVCLTGCGGGGGFFEAPGDEHGKTYYLDGAGNWGFGLTTVPAGLRNAGYPGNVEAYIWTSSFNPAVDQINIGMNKLRAAILTGKIEGYLRQYPGNDVNIIALSAGTGIAVWAVEGLKSSYKVNNLVLLGSSLSENYDMRTALGNIKGKVYVYYSPHDEVLGGAVRAIGTVDRGGTESAGLGGLHPPGGGRGKIINIGWRPKYERYGWTGSHTDATSEPFIQHYVSQHIFERRRPQPTSTQPKDRSEWRTKRVSGGEIAP